MQSSHTLDALNVMFDDQRVDRYPMSGPRAMRVVAVCWSSPR